MPPKEHPQQRPQGNSQLRFAGGMVLAIFFLLMAATSLAGALPSGTIGAWQETSKVTPADADEPTRWGTSHTFVLFGSSLALDGDTMVVGTAYDACDPYPWAYVFERTVRGWEQTAKLTAPGWTEENVTSDACEGFGKSVAIDESAGRIVIGDPGYSPPGGDTLQGLVHVFEETRNGWQRTASFLGPDTEPDPELPYDLGAHFGLAVDVHERTLVVGAPLDDHAGKHTGSVFVYHKGSSGWADVDHFTGPQYRSFLGGDVAVAEGRFIAGASQESSPAGPSSGTVHVYSQAPTGWDQDTILTPPSSPLGSTGTSFGGAVDISETGSRIVIGAIWSDEVAGVSLHPVDETINTGAAYVFDLEGEAWGMTAELQAPDPGYREWFGGSVAVSSDTVVVGAKKADGVSGLPNVEETFGSAYIFQPVVDEWVSTAKLRAGDTSPGDFFGHRVAADSDTVVVTAPFDDNRRDGMPPPVSDHGDLLPPPVAEDWNTGDGAGSVYVFGPHQGSNELLPG